MTDLENCKREIEAVCKYSEAQLFSSINIINAVIAIENGKTILLSGDIQPITQVVATGEIIEE